MTIRYIDHIIYATHDLDQAIDDLEQLLGVRATFGGQHPNAGSHNALLSLGDRTYLEIIAPDPNQPEPEKPRSFGLDSLATPKLVTWAAGSERLSAQVIESRMAGYDPGTVVDGGRKTPDGRQLAWQSAKHPNALVGKLPPGDGLVPFMIAWGETPHPSTVTPTGCRLISLRGEHPDPDAVSAMLDALQTPIPITQADSVQLIAEIETPNGIVELR